MSSPAYSWSPFASREFLRYLSIALVASAGLLGCTQETSDTTTSKDTKPEAVIGASVCIPPEGDRSSSEAIEIPVAGYTFKVPCSYLVEWHEDFIFIWLHWPGLKPYGDAEEEKDTTLVDVILRPEEKPNRSTYRTLVETALQVSNYTSPKVLSESGLIRFHVAENDTPFGGYYVAYEPPIKTFNGFPLTFRCSRCISGRTNCKCSTSYEVAEGLRLRLRFQRRALADWAEIQRGVEALIKRLMGDDS